MRSLIAMLVALTSLPVLANQCSELPVLFIVQDKSGSMSSFGPNGAASSTSNPSKWSIARTVVPALAQQFSNRFRFGAEMFPTTTGQFNCSAPTVVAEVSPLPDGVVSAYGDAVPGGGTPTAAALTLAKSHLVGLNLSTPKYVMLITDGLPNCNASLDSTSTSCKTTNGCSGPPDNHCGFGAIDCLDDVSSEAAAAALLASGIKVFVVGFGSAANGTNKPVLDSIASAGGTGTAYSAMNQAELTSVLNQIALDTTTCCNDVCTVGQTQCANSTTNQTCTYDPATKCNGWVSTACAPTSHCTVGKCQACINPCTPGAVQCGPNGDVQQCVVGTDSCTTWSSAQTCSSGSTCNAGTCGSCQACTAGATRCGAAGEETCTTQAHGCTAWVATPCTSGSTCQGTACKSCNGACTAGAKRCSADGKGTEICSADSAGCTSWKPAELCTDFCSGGACGKCGTTCTLGEQRCDGMGVEKCITDPAHVTCTVWSAANACATNHYCAGAGLCNECSTSCSQGAMRCGANGATEQCQLDSTGCTNWVAAGQCAAGDRCSEGACCHDACTVGALQCSVNGSPQTCILAQSTCTEWKTNPACFGTQLCIDGICRGPCADDEFHSCADGTVCTGTSDGGFCLPGDAGVIIVPGFDAGTTTTPGRDAGSGTSGTGGGNGSIGATAAGCGCMSFDGVAGLPLLGLALLSLRRRRS